MMEVWIREGRSKRPKRASKMEALDFMHNFFITNGYNGLTDRGSTHHGHNLIGSVRVQACMVWSKISRQVLKHGLGTIFRVEKGLKERTTSRVHNYKGVGKGGTSKDAAYPLRAILS